MQNKPAVSLTILDDHGLLVDSLSSWFTGNAPDFSVAVAETSWAGCLANGAFPSDVVLMDYQLAEPVSIEARVLTCKAAGSTVVVMSALASPELAAAQCRQVRMRYVLLGATEEAVCAVCQVA